MHSDYIGFIEQWEVCKCERELCQSLNYHPDSEEMNNTSKCHRQILHNAVH